ncbi:MAG: hypothetical protein VX733_07035 [Candidatus Latescibacterota bacterium]|nr:hypothetical protein [Candidatus Latescibacterota bacterium]
MAAHFVSRRAACSGDVLFHIEDEFGDIDVIDEGKGIRSLQFGSVARQSTMFIARPNVLALAYTQCMMTALALLVEAPQRALVLGLGGGSLVKFLLAQFPACRVDAVELRPPIVELAQQFFSLNAEAPNLQLHLIDGERFVEEAHDSQYDLIFVDLHDANGMAQAVTRPGFTARACACLRPGGVLVSNLWYGVDEGVERQVRCHLEQTFANVLYFPVAGKRNCVALCPRSSQPPSRNELEQRARDWNQEGGLDLRGLVKDLIRHNGRLLL